MILVLKKHQLFPFNNDKLIFLDVLPIGGNHITKDISLLLKIDINEAEKLKLNFEKNNEHTDNPNFSLEMLQKIAFARTEEILGIM